MDTGALKHKLEQHSGYVDTASGDSIMIKFANFDDSNDQLTFSINTEKKIILSDDSVGKTIIEHGVAISEKHNLLVIFRPTINEAFPKLFTSLMTGKTKPKIFHDIYYLKNRVTDYVTSMIETSDNDVQIVDPRFQFEGSLYRSMSYFMFSAGEFECATNVDGYTKALAACTKFEPILRFRKVRGLANDKLDFYKTLQLNEEGRFWSVGNSATIHEWLEFLYAHAMYFISPLTHKEEEYMKNGM